MSIFSQYGEYEVSYKEKPSSIGSFDDAKFPIKVMVIEANNKNDAQSIVEKRLKKNGNWYKIYDVKLVKYKSKSTNETNISSSKSSSEPAPYNPAVVKFLLILIAIVGGLGLLIFIGHSILSAIFL